MRKRLTVLLSLALATTGCIGVSRERDSDAVQTQVDDDGDTPGIGQGAKPPGDEPPSTSDAEPGNAGTVDQGGSASASSSGGPAGGASGDEHLAPLMLEKSDLPAGYRSDSRASDAATLLVAPVVPRVCGAEPEAKSTGRTRDFVAAEVFTSEQYSISEAVDVYGAEGVDFVLDQFDTSGVKECIDALAGLEVAVDFEFGVDLDTQSVTTIEPAPVGDRIVGLRAEYSVTSKEPISKIIYDIIGVKVGSALLSFTFVSHNDSDPAEVDRIVALAVEKFTAGFDVGAVSDGGAPEPVDDSVGEGGLFFQAISSDDLPAGDPGEVSIIVEIPPTDYRAYVFFRNNTDSDVTDVDISLVGADKSGAIVSTDTNNLQIVPKAVQPGDIGFSGIYSFDEVPADTEWTFTITDYGTGEPWGHAVTLEVVDPSTRSGKFEATVPNPYEIEVVGDYGAPVFCFDDKGAVVGVAEAYLDEQAIPALGESTLATYGPLEFPCDRFITGLGGVLQDF